MRSTLKKQAGASIFANLLVLIVAGFLFSIAFKLFPAYVDNRTFNSVLVDAMNDPEELAKGPKGIKASVRKKLVINQLNLPQKDSLTVFEDDGIITAILDYEVRVPMFGNIDAVVFFTNEYEAETP
ncbi:DUF4845 domain-containing protein [Neptuniibacter sp. QD48_11]|uniref:DUF4845 domain-containing protein n=1 Tax=unclassified Neptuniibacter TaxID=2630693 RepID=UPI0039F5FC9E